MHILNKDIKTDVFFDLDHTLWDFETNSSKAFENVFESYNVPFSLEQFLYYYVGINEALWYRYSLNLITQEELRIGRLIETFNKLNYKVDLCLIERFSNSYLEELPKNNYLFEGALELLDYLKDRYALHILTNGFQEVQFKKIVNSKIDSYFQTVTNSEIAGVKKPDPLIFKCALKQAGTSAERSVMIGDNLIADIKGALEVGMDAIYFNPVMNSESSSSTLQVSRLLDIKNIL